MENIYIESLYEKLNDLLSQHFTGMLVECCAICLNAEGHTQSVKLHPYLHTKNEITSALKLSWDTNITDKILASYRDENRTTDHAAMCLALLIASQLTDFKYIETSKMGDGVDFWLSKTDKFDFFARVEVSGIRKAKKENSVKKRLTIKLTQTNQSDNTNIPVYVCIVEFSKPEALYIQK